MTLRQWVKLDELREPGMRRVLEAMKQLQEENPGLIEQAAIASQRKDSGREGGVPR
jgi:hypothetical protein